MPIWFYRVGLGKLLGHRFLELTHTGRKSGLPRHTILEVVRYDKEKGIYYVAVGFGERSDWYQNIMANHHVEVCSAGKSIRAIAVLLTDDESGSELVRYAHQHPIAFRQIVHIIGYRVAGTDADIHMLGQHLHMFALKPISNSARDNHQGLNPA
jgi:deazaflavin-dependent oxidoreductase (nitroreductase family)